MQPGDIPFEFIPVYFGLLVRFSGEQLYVSLKIGSYWKTDQIFNGIESLDRHFFDADIYFLPILEDGHVWILVWDMCMHFHK